MVWYVIANDSLKNLHRHGVDVSHMTQERRQAHRAFLRKQRTTLLSSSSSME
jgi:hypothetical protein